MAKCVALELAESAPAGLETGPPPKARRPSILWVSSARPRVDPPIVFADRVMKNMPREVIPRSHSRARHSPVCLHVDFGGATGEKLPLLNTITGVLDIERRVLRGFYFAYDDGHKASY